MPRLASPKQALGEERRRAPCLPPHIFASLLALPIEHDRHGHPGLLYARRSGSAELESWIEGYRMCYSFSAKGTVANLVADSLQQCGEQELAGWFFVGEGAGLEYASNIAAAMYSQFRLAFSKAFAGVEKSLDEAAYDHACAMCSQMTGVVLLRSVGQLEGTGEKQGLRYEVHEFAFPLPRQKLKQEIRARLKSNAELEVVEENSNGSANMASSSSVCEVVDLISDDEEQNDDTPVIFLEDTRKRSFAPRDTSGEADEPPLDVALASSESIEAAAFPASCMDPSAVRTWQDIASEQWQQATCYQRWVSECMAIRANPDHATDLYDTLEKQRQALFASVMQNMSESRSSMVQASIPVSGDSVCHVRPKGKDERAPAAVNTSAGKGMLAGKDLASFAKLRIGFRARASVDRDSQRSATGELAALSQQPAQAREGEQQCGQDRPDPHGQMLDLSLHEYDKACSTCCHLLSRAHAKAQLKSQPGGATGDDDCPLILNSVMVSILHEAFSRAGADGVHGVLAGFKRGDQIVVTHARATSEGLPPCAGDGESGASLAWLREQAQKLFPQALLHPETKISEICAESPCNAGQEDRSGRQCIMATKEENSNALGAEAVQGESCAASREVMVVKEEDGSNALSHLRSAVQCNGLHVKMPPCSDLDDAVRPHQAADVQEQSGGEELNRVVKEHPDEDRHCGSTQVENQQSSLMPQANPKVGIFDRKEEGTDDSDSSVLTVLGYFRVACTTSAPDAGEVDRRRLCALNGRGVGLVCTIQKSEQVLSSPDLAKFMCFGVEEQPASQMAWEVQQDPFLPGRVLRQWASASQDEAGDQDEAEAAATLVKLHTMNLRLQEAYIKRQLSLSAVTSLGVCRGVFRVGRQLHGENCTGQLQPAEQAPDEQARHSASPASRPEHAVRESGGDYGAPYETCAGAPGWRKYYIQDEHRGRGTPYFYHPERGDLTQWDPPPGWFDNWQTTGQQHQTGADKLSVHRSATTHYLSCGGLPPGMGSYMPHALHAYPPFLQWGGQGASALSCAKPRKQPTCKKCGQLMKGHKAELCYPKAASPCESHPKRPLEQYYGSQPVSAQDPLEGSEMPSKKLKCDHGE